MPGGSKLCMAPEKWTQSTCITRPVILLLFLSLSSPPKVTNYHAHPSPSVHSRGTDGWMLLFLVLYLESPGGPQRLLAAHCCGNRHPFHTLSFLYSFCSLPSVFRITFQIIGRCVLLIHVSGCPGAAYTESLARWPMRAKYACSRAPWVHRVLSGAGSPAPRYASPQVLPALANSLPWPNMWRSWGRGFSSVWGLLSQQRTFSCG